MYLESLDSTAGRVVAGTEAHRGPTQAYKFDSENVI